MNNIQIAAQTILFIAIIAGTSILIPQVIRLHKNKYADNSSLGLYGVYLGCNIIWTIYQIVFIMGTSRQAQGTVNWITLWVQFAGDVLQVLFGAYSFCLKLYYMISAKNKKDNSIWIVLKRRAEVALFLRKEKQPMHEIFNELLKKYPQLKPVIEKEASRKKKTVAEYINSSNAVELAVINAECFKKIINKKFNVLDVDVAKNYKKYTDFVVDKIHWLFPQYPDIINGLYHYRIIKVPLWKAKKYPKNRHDLNVYLTRLNLVDKWAFLSQIYQSLLGV